MEGDRGPATWITKLALPSLSLLATIVSLIRDQPVLAWCLSALTVVIFLSGFGGAVVARARAFGRLQYDNRLARRSWADLSALVEQYAAFVNPSSNDTLHAAATAVHDQKSQEIARVIRGHGLVPIEVFYGAWEHVRQHCREENRSLKSLQRTVTAFNWLVATYNYHVFQAVFYRARQELRPLLDADRNSAFELSREKFIRFLDDYAAFLQNLNTKLRTALVELPTFQRVGPL